MKKIIVIFLVFQCYFTEAQVASGVVEYKVLSEEFKVKNKNASEATKKIFSNLSRYLKYITFTLDFNKNESLYQQNETMEFEGDAKFHIKFAKLSAGREIFYTNYDSNEKLIKENFLGKKFLIKGIFNNKQWTVSKETKMVGKYRCYKAVYVDKENPLLSKPRTIVAWFSVDIPVPFGLKGYGGLPGLILELKEGPLTYYASEIDIKKKSKEISKPHGGKEIAEEDFIDIVLEKSKMFERKKKS